VSNAPEIVCERSHVQEDVILEKDRVSKERDRVGRRKIGCVNVLADYERDEHKKRQIKDVTLTNVSLKMIKRHCLEVDIPREEVLVQGRGVDSLEEQRTKPLVVKDVGGVHKPA